MPTGYTYRIEEDPNFGLREFALTCSGFPVDLTYDDLPLTSNVEETDYLIEEIIDHVEDAIMFNELSLADFQTVWQYEVDESNDNWNEIVDQKVTANTRYTRMQANILKWNTVKDEEIDDLKSFMLEQITASKTVLDIHLGHQDYPDDYAEQKIKVLHNLMDNIRYFEDRLKTVYDKADERTRQAFKLLRELDKIEQTTTTTTTSSS